MSNIPLDLIQTINREAKREGERQLLAACKREVKLLKRELYAKDIRIQELEVYINKHGLK